MSVAQPLCLSVVHPVADVAAAAAVSGVALATDAASGSLLCMVSA